MAPRLQLHEILTDIVDHVYFQPPENIQMQYPAIVYLRAGSSTDHADNVPYRHAKRYQVTVIDRNPDSNLPDQVEDLNYCELDRTFAADELNHWVFTLYF